MDKNSFKYAGSIQAVLLDKGDQPKEHWLETVAGRVLGILVLIAMFATVGGFDYSDKVAAEAKAKRERAARIAAYEQYHRELPRLSHPCGATIREGMTSVTMGPERCVRVKESKR